MDRTSKKSLSKFKNISEPKSQKYNKSIMKSQKSFGSINSNSLEKNKQSIKNIYLSTAYNNVFNRLMNIRNLQEFVKQSSQYITFHQKQVQKYIPHQKDRKRFSFALNHTICEFLQRDYRFLWHYFNLLCSQYPERKKQLKQQIYQYYKQIVNDINKFDSYFSHNQIAKKSYNRKENKFNDSNIKVNSKQRSGLKSKQKNLNKYQKEIQMKNENPRNTILKSKMKAQKIQKSQYQKLNNQKLIQKNQNQFIQKCKKPSNSNLKNETHILKQNELPQKSKESLKKRRTTMQNIHIIQETLNEIQHICQSKKQVTKKQSENKQPEQTAGEDSFFKSQQEAFNTQGQSEKNIQNCLDKRVNASNQKDNFDAGSLNFHPIQQDGEEEIQLQKSQLRKRKSKKYYKQTEYQQNLRLLGCENKKSKTKIKTTKQKKNQKRFIDVIDLDDPKNKEIIQRMKKREEQCEKNKSMKKEANLLSQKFKISRYQHQTSIKRPFDEYQKQKLTKLESQIVELFPEINTIGHYTHFNIDKKVYFYECFGLLNEYKLEQVLASPSNNDPYGEVYKGLLMTKIKDTDLDNLTKIENADQLKIELDKKGFKDITLLLIER